MGSTVLFDRELCVGDVVGAVDVDINESIEGNVGVFFSLSRMEILSEIACSG